MDSNGDKLPFGVSLSIAKSLAHYPTVLTTERFSAIPYPNPTRHQTWRDARVVQRQAASQDMYTRDV